MPFQKGVSGNPAGKPKGTQSKMSRDLKEMILGALDKAGGLEYLTKQADANPQAFLNLVGKVLPMTVTGGDAPIRLTVEWQQTSE